MGYKAPDKSKSLSMEKSGLNNSNLAALINNGNTTIKILKTTEILSDFDPLFHPISHLDQLCIVSMEMENTIDMNKAGWDHPSIPSQV
jgi:hypothetical protein